MNKIINYTFFLLTISFTLFADDKPIVEFTKQIILPEFPYSHNPSIVKTDKGYLLSFRYCPNIKKNVFSEIGVVLLDERFNLISKPQLLKTRWEGHSAPPQAEDARLFAHKDKIYAIYTDNLDQFVGGTLKVRRDMHIAELICKEDGYELSPPLLLLHVDKYFNQPWERNWSPFVFEDNLLFSYYIAPHEVLEPDLKSGECKEIYWSEGVVNFWKWGQLRGGTPAELVDGQYLAFFHSTNKGSPEFHKTGIMYYYAGAYTFSAEPPFKVQRVSSKPLEHPSFYNTDKPWKVIFPGGFVINNDSIYLVYGRNNDEMWVAKIDKNALMNSLTDVLEEYNEN